MSTASPQTPAPIHDANLAVHQITRLSVGVAVFLIAIKAFALGASGSVSILASLGDSVLDLVASLATFFAVRWAAQPADAEHRYGHGKGEAMAGLVQSGLVFASALFIAWEALNRIAKPEPVSEGGVAIVVVLISIAVTIWLVWMQTRALKKNNSLAVQGDRAHYAADIAASVVVLIGVASGAFLNASGLDAAAGLVVAIWLFWGATGILRAAGDHLLDRSASDEDLKAITQVVLSDARISGLHQLRTRQSGSALMVQMHVDLEPTLTLKAAHDIVVEAEQRILLRFPNADILIHADPHGKKETVLMVESPNTGNDLDTPATPEDAEVRSKGPWS